jgi:hypothetical protein
MIPKISKQEFLEKGFLAIAVEEALRRKPDAIGVVLFENQTMDSSSRGAMTAMVIGPTNTYKSAEDCEGKHLNDLPSQRQYPVAWVSREAFIDD